MNSLVSAWPWETRENQGLVQAIKTVVDPGEGPTPVPPPPPPPPPAPPLFLVLTEVRRAEKLIYL